MRNKLIIVAAGFLIGHIMALVIEDQGCYYAGMYNYCTDVATVAMSLFKLIDQKYVNQHAYKFWPKTESLKDPTSYIAYLSNDKAQFHNGDSLAEKMKHLEDVVPESDDDKNNYVQKYLIPVGKRVTEALSGLFALSYRYIKGPLLRYRQDACSDFVCFQNLHDQPLSN